MSFYQKILYIDLYLCSKIYQGRIHQLFVLYYNTNWFSDIFQFVNLT